MATASVDVHPILAAGVNHAPVLSVIVPIYNEARTVDALLRRVLDGPYPGKQIVVVDDGSTDATPDLLRHWEGQMTLLRHPRNLGKGAAVRTGLAHALGEATIIQDADLEYDPAEYPRLVEPILHGDAEVVYGSRYLAPLQPLPWTKFRVAEVVLNMLVRVLYGRRITDEATCYKAFRTPLLRSLDLRAKRFELCPELTAKLCRLGIPIVEVPISYHPRGAEAGKKIRWYDGWQAVWTLLKWRVKPFATNPSRMAASQTR
jgi:dolichol-phosphate mannosyltransferase